MDVVHTKAALHAQAIVICGAVTAFHTNNLFVFDVIGNLATDAAEWADRIDLAIDGLRTNQALRHQRTGWASLHALTAGHAGALAHRIAQVKHDLAVCTAHRVTNHVVDLLFTASTHAPITLNTGV